MSGIKRSWGRKLTAGKFTIWVKDFQQNDVLESCTGPKDLTMSRIGEDFQGLFQVMRKDDIDGNKVAFRGVVKGKDCKGTWLNDRHKRSPDPIWEPCKYTSPKLQIQRIRRYCRDFTHLIKQQRPCNSSGVRSPICSRMRPIADLEDWYITRLFLN